MSKKLVAYFSASGVTKRAIERLAKQQEQIFLRSVPRFPTSGPIWIG